MLLYVPITSSTLGPSSLFVSTEWPSAGSAFVSSEVRRAVRAFIESFTAANMAGESALSDFSSSGPSPDLYTVGNVFCAQSTSASRKEFAHWMNNWILFSVVSFDHLMSQIVVQSASCNWY